MHSENSRAQGSRLDFPCQVKALPSKYLRRYRAILAAGVEGESPAVPFELGAAVGVRALIGRDPVPDVHAGLRTLGLEDLAALRQHGHVRGVAELGAHPRTIRRLVEGQLAGQRWTLPRRRFLAALGLSIAGGPSIAARLFAQGVQAYCGAPQVGAGVFEYVRWLAAVWSDDAWAGRRVWPRAGGEARGLLPDVRMPTWREATALFDLLLHEDDWERLLAIVTRHPVVAVENACARRLLSRLSSRPRAYGLLAPVRTRLEDASQAVGAALGDLAARDADVTRLSGAVLHDLLATAAVAAESTATAIYERTIYAETLEGDGRVLDIVDFVFGYYGLSDKRPADVRRYVELVGQQVAPADGRFEAFPVMAAEGAARAAWLWRMYGLGETPEWLAAELKRANAAFDGRAAARYLVADGGGEVPAAGGPRRALT